MKDPVTSATRKIYTLVVKRGLKIFLRIISNDNPDLAGVACGRFQLKPVFMDDIVI